MDSVRLDRSQVSETTLVDLLTVWVEALVAPEPAAALVTLAQENRRLRVELDGLRAELARRP